LKTTDDNVSGGGDNTVKNPPALGTTPEQPAVPAPVPTPPTPVITPRVEPAPQQAEKAPTPIPKDPPRINDTPKVDLTSIKPIPRKTREINADTTVVTSSAADAKAKRDAQAKAAAAEQKRLAGIAAAFKSATTGIRGGVSKSTEIRLAGPGGGGLPYANFLSAVQTVYYNAWHQPDSAPELAVKVSVSIARDGTVISAHVVSPSGNSVLDKSVRETIERVKFAAPLPDNSTEDSRTVIINFKTQPPDAG
jgi:TonB family protein